MVKKSLKFQDFFQLMRNEYTVSGEEESIVPFGKLVADSIDDVPSYEEFERHILL